MWIGLWKETHQSNGFTVVRMCWPDGKSLLEQPAIAVAMFKLVTEEFNKVCQT